jgi:hypothetical protein
MLCSKPWDKTKYWPGRAGLTRSARARCLSPPNYWDGHGVHGLLAWRLAVPSESPPAPLARMHAYAC